MAAKWGRLRCISKGVTSRPGVGVEGGERGEEDKGGGGMFWRAAVEFFSVTKTSNSRKSQTNGSSLPIFVLFCVRVV